MVSFNGVRLDAVAPVRILDGVDNAATVALVLRERVVSNGAYFAQRRLSTMKEVVTFTLPVSDSAKRESYMRAIRAWCTTTAPAPLLMPKYDGLYTMAICSAMPTRSARDWWEELTIEFVVPEPCYIEAARHINVLSAIPFTVEGTYNPLAQIKYTVPASTSDLTWTLDGVTFSLAGVVATGELVIDLNTKTATVAGASVLGQIPLSQDIPDLSPGVHVLTGNGSLLWQTRWV